MKQFFLNQYDPEELKKLFSDVLDKKINLILRSQNSGVTFLTRKEAAEKLKISLPTLNHYTSMGWIKSHRIGGRVLYINEEVEKALVDIGGLKYKKG